MSRRTLIRSHNNLLSADPIPRIEVIAELLGGARAVLGRLAMRYAKLPQEHLLQELVIKDDTQSVPCLLKLLGES